MLDNGSRRQAILAIGVSLCLAAMSLPARAEAVTSVDLGQAPVGTIDVFKVETRNTSCEEPQNFRFVPRDLPWLKLVNGGSVRNVERGKAKLFVARIDLSGLKPGRYSGHLDIVCETCGAFVLTRCDIDVRSLTIEVEVIAAGQRRKRPSDEPVLVRAEAPPR